MLGVSKPLTNFDKHGSLLRTIVARKALIDTVYFKY